MSDAKTLDTLYKKDRIERFEYIPTDKIIDSSTLDPHVEFDSETVKRLEESIRAMGGEVIDLIIVRQKGDKFETVDGRHRVQAARNVHLARVPAFVKDLTDEELDEQRLVTNIMRRRTSEPEIGWEIRGLLKNYPHRYKNQAELSRKIGISKERISMYVSETTLPIEVQKLIAPENESRRIPAGHIDGQVGYEIFTRFKDEDDERKIEVAQTLAKHGFTGHRGKQLVRKIATEEYAHVPIEKVIEDVQLEERYKHKRLPRIELNEIEAQAFTEGRKTTALIKTPYQLKPGAEVELWTPIGKVKVEMIYLKTLKNIKIRDAQNEGYKGLEELKEGWIGKYGAFDENERAYIVVFERR